MKFTKRRINQKINRKINRKLGGASELNFKNGEYEDEHVEKEYTVLKNTLKKNQFFDNQDVLRKIFGYSFDAGKNLIVVQQLIEKYPKLEKLIKHFLGYPTDDKSKYFDLAKNRKNLNLQYKIEFLQPHNYIYRPLDNAYFQRHIEECLQIHAVNEFFENLNDSVYAEPENATTSEIDALKSEITQLIGVIWVTITLKENVDENNFHPDGLSYDDVLPDLTNDVYGMNVKYLCYKDDAPQNISESHIPKEVLAGCTQHTKKTSPQKKSPQKTSRKRKRYPEATRKSTRNKR
jgi:hypothetical protein